MNLKRLSLRTRIFIGMILLVLMASVLIASVAIYQYKEETKDYHQQRLERKEKAIQSHINFVLKETSYPVTTKEIPLIFKDEIYKIADVHSLQLNLYDLDGTLLKTSRATFTLDTMQVCIRTEILNELSNTAQHHYIEKSQENGETFQSSYSYITDQKSKPLAILNLPYLENDEFLSKELNEFLLRLLYAYSFVLLMAVGFAFLLSKYITKSLKTISDKINTTRLEKSNEKIEIGDTSEEINVLVNSYNSMIDELEESAVKLATSEREQAWREMAKQVAHEIKNPLTPMRLTVQNFQRKFDPTDENIHKKVDEYSKTLIQQIDTMSPIASAFSNFAKMPAQQNETLNVVKIVKLALDIFNEEYIEFSSDAEEIIVKFDRTQLIRVVTNLVKNGIQAIPNKREPKIKVSVRTENNQVIITVSDNGAGVLEENKMKVFEPKFNVVNSLEEVHSLISKNDDPLDTEGFVIVDNSFNRIKVKNPRYDELSFKSYSVDNFKSLKNYSNAIMLAISGQEYYCVTCNPDPGFGSPSVSCTAVNPGENLVFLPEQHCTVTGPYTSVVDCGNSCPGYVPFDGGGGGGGGPLSIQSTQTCSTSWNPKAKNITKDEKIKSLVNDFVSFIGWFNNKYLEYKSTGNVLVKELLVSIWSYAFDELSNGKSISEIIISSNEADQVKALELYHLIVLDN